MPKNQNTLACYLDKKTRTTQDVHFSAPSQLPKVTQTQATRDNAYEIIGPDHESPQGANNISVAEVSPIPLGSYHDR
ncbi:uncharacterized protein LOC142573211 isoform X3 [Dermacentor variabilis]